MSLAADLGQLWSDSAKMPDLEVWYPSVLAAAVAPEELLEALRLDQQLRWKTDVPWPAEFYLTRLRPLPGMINWRLELAVGEWLAGGAARTSGEAAFMVRFTDLTGLWLHLVEWPQRADAALMISSVVERFVTLLRSEAVSPCMEYSLAMLPVSQRVEAFEQLLELELAAITARGQIVETESLFHRFPRYAAQIEQLLSGLSEGNEELESVVTEPELLMSGTQPVRLSADIVGTTLVAEVVEKTAEDEVIPNTIAGYQIERLIGRGGCGRVLLGRDPETGARVALKQIRERERSNRAVQLLRREAAMAAALTQSLNVAGIVRLHGIVEHDDLPVMVMDYIEGEDLAQRLKTTGRSAQLRWQKQSPETCVAIVRELAEILQHTHEQGYYHRDLKPANVLVDRTGKLWLTDFGIALHESEWNSDPAVGGGTLAYMAPEQLQGESSRIDGRVDIWSLGVILYQLLSGRLPWYGRHAADLIDQISRRGHSPLRQRDRSIPERLSLICDKCLRVNRDSRYSSVAALLDDLENWQLPAGESGLHSTSMLSGSSTSLRGPVPIASFSPADGANEGGAAPTAVPDIVSQPLQVRIRPRGLDSYEEADRHFFLRLLPGDVEPDGLPESLHYWLKRLRVRVPLSTDDSLLFQVGVIHGSSGCGKSSFVKAGLLPMLPDNCLSIYLEASAGTTELLLLKRLRGLFPAIPADLPLPEVFRRLHEGDWMPPEQRLLIVLDQFEQWLDQNGGSTGTPLARSLRHCSAGRVQAILLVREEFWTATSEFMTTQLNLDLSTRLNDQMLPLFSVSHARLVLSAFGEWYGRLPQNPAERTAEQLAFLEQAVQGLSRKGRVIPVQLAVFAQIFRDLEWTPNELARQGGAAGAGERFLEQQFSSVETSERNRRHFDAVCRILEEMLPPAGSQIRGRMQPRRRLLEVSGYLKQPARFDDLLQILELELRIITRTDAAEQADSETPETFYLLTHDFLVPSIRSWVEAELEKSRSGRALSRLRVREKIYSERRESRQLPSLFEWLQIRFSTDSSRWTRNQQIMMQTAGWKHLRTAIVSLSIGVLIATGVFFESQRQRALMMPDAIRTLENSSGNGVPASIAALKNFADDEVVEELNRRFQNARRFPQRLAITFALAEFGSVSLDFLMTHLDNISGEDTANLMTALRKTPEAAVRRLQAAAADCTAPERLRSKVRFAIAAMGLGDTSLAEDVCETEGRDSHVLRSYFIEELARWRLTVEEIIATAKDTDSSALKSAICLGIGSRPENDLTIDEKATAEFLARNCLGATDATTHLAARWLLRKMAVPVPMEDSWHVKKSDRGWFLSHRNSVLIRIQPPPERTQFLLQGVTVLSPSHQYWIAAEEVSRGDFEACLADSEYHKTDTDLIKRFTAEVGTSAARASQLYSPTPEHPAQDISWYDALRYCNWLSTRDGLIPVYRFRGRQIELLDGGLQVEAQNWEVDPTGNGYRLPTTEEWIYACRAGSQTAWTCGSDPGVLSAWCRMQPSEVTSICGIRLPNAWGLHDVHGNVQEWCHSTDPTGRLRRICGGAAKDSATDCSAARSSQDRPDAHTKYTGFRLAMGPLIDHSNGWAADNVPDRSPSPDESVP